MNLFNKHYFSAKDLLLCKHKMPAVYAAWPFLSPQTRAVTKTRQGPIKVLDLGCGEGWFIETLLRMRPDAKIEAVDLEDNRQVHRDDPRVNFHQWNLEQADYPFAPGQFDFINCTHVIEHLRKPEVVFEQIKRLLSPTGIAYVEAPDVRWTLLPHLPLITSDRGGFNFWDDPTHLRPYSRPAMRKMAEISGLKCNYTFYARKWAHLAVLPMAIFSRNNDYKTACLQALLGLWCGAVLSLPEEKE